MKNKLKIFAMIASSVILFGCEQIGDKIQEKVNEKVDKTLDEGLRKADSVLSNVGKQLDTLGDKSFKEMDSIKYQLDSANKEIKEMIEKQKKLIDKK